MSPHPQLIFIRLRCHLLPTVWTLIDVGIVALRVLAIVPVIRCHLLPAIWAHIDVGIERSPPGLGNSTNNWFEVEVWGADKHKENCKTNHNSLDPGYSVCCYFRNYHLRVHRYHNRAGCSKAADTAHAFLHAVQASGIAGSAAGFASGFVATSTAAE